MGFPSPWASLQDELRRSLSDLSIHKQLFMFTAKLHEFGALVGGECIGRTVARVGVGNLHSIAQRGLDEVEILRNFIKIAVANLTKPHGLRLGRTASTLNSAV